MENLDNVPVVSPCRFLPVGDCLRFLLADEFPPRAERAVCLLCFDFGWVTVIILLFSSRVLHYSYGIKIIFKHSDAWIVITTSDAQV